MLLLLTRIQLGLKCLRKFENSPLVAAHHETKPEALFMLLIYHYRVASGVGCRLDIEKNYSWCNSLWNWVFVGFRKLLTARKLSLFGTEIWRKSSFDKTFAMALPTTSKVRFNSGKLFSHRKTNLKLKTWRVLEPFWSLSSSTQTDWVAEMYKSKVVWSLWLFNVFQHHTIALKQQKKDKKRPAMLCCLTPNLFH